jgi:hypothetical protein
MILSWTGGCATTGTDSPGQITSRYAEQDNVIIDPQKVPEDLRDLVPLARKWAIGDDVERADFMKSATIEEKKELVDRVSPKMDRIERYCAPLREQIPAPDEVVLFDMLMESVEEARPEIYPGK